MKIDDKLFSALEDISCFSFSGEEKSLIAEDLQKNLNIITHLSDLNTDGVPESTNPLNIENVFREDEAQPSFDRKLILQNAPFKNDEMFTAPRTVD